MNDTPPRSSAVSPFEPNVSARACMNCSRVSTSTSPTIFSRTGSRSDAIVSASVGVVPTPSIRTNYPRGSLPACSGGPGANGQQGLP
jgi:hypothetical protein